MARPEKDINPDQVEELAAIFCSYAEMAAVLDCDEKTLSNRFSQAIKKGRDRGKQSLKRKQWEVAMAGNVTMLIWLGKQHLGQSEQVIPDDVPLKHTESEHFRDDEAPKTDTSLQGSSEV